MNLTKHYKKESPFLNLLGMGGGVGSSLVGGGSEYWIATLGGSSEERGQDIAIDSNENIFVVGRTSSAGPGDKSAYIAKFDNLGSLEWQRTLGGTSEDQFYGVVIGSSDDVYVCGLSVSQGPGSNDTLMVKYNNSGTLQWQKVNGTTLSDYLYSIAIDSSDNVYATGVLANASNLSAIAIYKRNSSGTLQIARNYDHGGSCQGAGIVVYGSDQYISGRFDNGSPSFDHVILKVNQYQNIVWQRSLGSNLADLPARHGLAVDSSGNVYAAVQFIDGFYDDIEVVKYNSSGTIQWQRRITQYSPLTPAAITVDDDDNVYVVGQFSGGAGSRDIFIAKWNSSGTLQFQRALGGTGADYGEGIKVVGDNMYITAYTASDGEGSDDIFIAKLPNDGSKTGTYGSFTYQTTSLTESAGSLSGSTPGLAISSAKNGPTESTSTLTDAAATLTEDVTKI
jgi:hypothetical protein|tara:strand:- start:18 stop:1370 length:1353 start_codon:yes stop_codon:yes gene_type:complete